MTDTEYELELRETSLATDQQILDAIDAASDQNRTTWLTNGGKRIAKIAPVDEVPDLPVSLPDPDTIRRLQQRLQADGAAFRQGSLYGIEARLNTIGQRIGSGSTEGILGLLTRMEVLQASVARQVEEIHRTLGLERDEEGDLVADQSNCGNHRPHDRHVHSPGSGLIQRCPGVQPPSSQGKFTPGGPVTIQVLADVLSLAGVRAFPLETLARWTHGQRVDAYDWAIREHLAASDTGIARVVRPAFLPAEGS